MTFPLPLPAGTDTHYIQNLGATSYTAPAVHFNEGVNLTSAEGFGTPTCISFSFWFNMASYNAEVHNADFNFFNIQNHDNSDSYAYGITGQDDWSAAGLFFNWWAGDPESNYIAWNLPANYCSTNLINNQWHHILCTVRSDGQVVLYIDDQHIGVPPQTVSENWPANTPLDLQGILTLPIEAGSGQDFDMADVWIAPGVDLTDDNGLIPTATRRQFISDHCQPVDPSNFPPASIILSGDHTTFPVNQGTGPELTLTGELVDSTGGSPTAGARVQIDGLKGGIYAILAAAAAGDNDWTGTNLYILSPVFGYNVTRLTRNGDGNATPALANSVVFQMYGPKSIDVAITRIQNTTLPTATPLLMMLTEDTVFEYAGGCGTNGTFYNATCADWNGGSVDIEPLHPNGTWLPSLQTFGDNGSSGITMWAGTYRIVGVSSLNAPLAVSITPINMNSTGQSSGIAITEVSAPFSLSGGVFGFASACSDVTNPTIKQYMPDGSILPRDMPQNQAFQPYLPGGTYVVDPTNLSGPLTYTLTPVNGDRQVLILNGITEDTEFQLEGCPLEWQAAVTCADWNGATLTLEYQLPDGSWSPANGGTTATENTSWWPTTPSGTYRITGVSDLNAPLYVGFSNTSYHSATDSQNFTINATTQEFTLQGGQYAMTYASHGNGGSTWDLNFQSPDGTWVNINSFNDGPQFTWQWYAAGRYQIDASALDNPLQVSFMGWPL